MIDGGQRGSGIGYWINPDVVALEGFDKSLSHAIAFRAFDWGDTRDEVERQGDLDSPAGGEDRTIVGEPLHRMRRPERAETLLDAADHHVTDHLAGAGGRRNPTDRLAVMSVEGEGDTHHLAAPTGERQRVLAPAAVRLDGHDLAVMLARPPASGMTFEQQPMLLHQPVDALRLATRYAPVCTVLGVMLTSYGRGRPNNTDLRKYWYPCPDMIRHPRLISE
jgi:hypothetical protein